MKAMRKIVLLAGAALFLTWIVLYSLRGAARDPEWVIRLTLGSLFALLILLRGKGEPTGDAKDRAPAGSEEAGPAWRVTVLVILGTVLALIGIIAPIHQFEWLGILLLFYACLRWALPSSRSRDILLALFVLYWVHPLPWQVFGKLQLWMQWCSVKGAEWLLQCANVCVWADGFSLRTGLRVFGVPEACSGMRTAVTLLLYGLGVGMLFRLRWHETLLFLMAGVAQVVALNILRIHLMVVWAPRMPAAWGQTFLHDTLGAFLLITIAILQIELSLWKHRRDKRRRESALIASGEAEPPDMAHWMPQFWVIVKARGWVILLAALALGAVSAAVYRQRPAHRAAMITRVLDGLSETDLEAAERAVNDALKVAPGKRDLLTRRAHILVRRLKFEETLKQIEALGGAPDPMETVIKSWALVGLNRMDDAAALLDGLPDDMKQTPGVAIIRAEYAAQKNKPDEVSRNAVLAAKSHRTIERVRRLFPYLARHEHWKAIANCRHPAPFTELPPALIAIEAELRHNNVAGAAEVMKRAHETWPRDPRLLSSLYALARVHPDREWEQMFADGMTAGLPTLDADRLASYITYSFRLARPDLAWAAYRRLAEMDARDPALYLAPAQFAPLWFTFRRHQAGMEAGTRDATVDMRSEYAAKKDDPAFKLSWEKIPLAEEMSRPDIDKVRRKYLDLCVRELARREKEGTASPRMEFTLPVALSMAGRYDEAQARLLAIEKKHPERKGDIILQQAVVHDRQARWQDVYETMRRYREIAGYPSLQADLVMVNALINLDLGMLAMETAKETARRFSDSPVAESALAAVWDAFGFKEQALFILTRREGVRDWPIVAQLLYDTGRTREAEKLSAALGVRIARERADENRGRVVAAEVSATNRWPKVLTDQDMSRLADDAGKAAERSVSPFLRDLYRLEAGWYRQRGKGEASDPDAWAGIGRDNMEKASALHRLTTLHAQARDSERAKETAGRAADLVPRSCVLRRIQIALSQGDRAVVERAREACPDDPEIWLASLVTRIRGSGSDPAAAKWAEDEVKSVVAAARFPVETMVRAGDYLLRRGMTAPATVAAQDAVKRARGLVVAHVLAMRCAVAAKDLKNARSCALAGADYADDPKPFYAMIVNLSFAGKAMDADLVRALEYLKEHFPKEAEWTERLGHVYFQNGNPGRALSLLGPLVSDDIKSVRLGAVLLAAESARLEGKPATAVSILEAANAMYPGTLSVLNNLVYNLALNPDTAVRAKALLPDLLKLGGDSFLVMDTAATVCLKNGQPGLAEEYMKKALAGLDEGNLSAPEVKVNAARILLAMGERQEAEKKAQEVIRNPKCAKIVEMEARKVLREIDVARLEETFRDAEGLYENGKSEEARKRLSSVLGNSNCAGALEKRARALQEKLDRERNGRGKTD